MEAGGLEGLEEEGELEDEVVADGGAVDGSEAEEGIDELAADDDGDGFAEGP